MTQDSMPTGPGAADGPGVADPRAHVAWQLRRQGAVCAAMGSPLYAALLAAAARDVEIGGPCWPVLRHFVAPGRGDAVALRFLAAVHRLVLTRRAPELALHYPSVGGRAGIEGAWPAFRAVVASQTGAVRNLLRLPCQTNEVGRAAALIGGFLQVAERNGLPLRLLEVGASAGLNLRWDRFRYGGGGAHWGDPASPVDLGGLWSGPPPALGARVVVAERRGCDLAPVDATTPDGRLALSAAVWADQTERFARLRGALAIARTLPVAVDRAPLDTWLAGQLAQPAPGRTTVVFHSVVEEYLPDTTRAAFQQALRAAGEQADATAPLAWLRLEPAGTSRTHALRLTCWPGGDTTQIASCGAHGQQVRWAAYP